MSNPGSMELILFDFDGVLADTRWEILAAARAAAAAIGHPCEPTLDILLSLKRMEFEEFGQRMGIPDEAVPAFVERVFPEMARLDGIPRVFEKMDTVIESLARDTRLGIITGNRSAYVERFLDAHALSPSFSFVYGSDHVGSKADKIRKSLDRTETPASRTCMIGDAASDILAAKEASVTSIAVTWGNQAVELLRAEKPDHLVGSPDELLRLFRVNG